MSPSPDFRADFSIIVATQPARSEHRLSPRRHDIIAIEPGAGRMALSLSHRALTQTLVAMLGAPVTRPLEFVPSVQLSSGYGRTLAAHVRAAIEDLEQSESLLRHSLSLQSFEQLLIKGLLLSHPHNYSAALLRPAPAVASRDVKRAIEFIESHAAAPIGIAEMVAASAVSGRALFQHFRRFTGMSPMQYLRETRLRRAREALLSAQPEEQVASVAARWGFTHMGRFSSEYRRRFGEMPSQTKRSANNLKISNVLV